MWQYLLKRLLFMIPTLLGIITVCFGFTLVVPGGPVEQMMSEIKSRQQGATSEVGGTQEAGQQKGELEKEQIEHLKKIYGFDQPIYVQYLGWIKRLVLFDFGESYFHNKKVTELIWEKLPVSVSLGFFGLILAYGISIPLGISRAVRQGTQFDAYSGMIVLIAYSAPGFVVGILLLVLFGGGSFLSIFPLRGLTSDNFSEMTFLQQVQDYLWHLVLPMTAYALNSFAWLTQLTRNLFLEEISQQYTITARAKGVSEKWILWKHIFRNAMLIVISGFPAALIGMFFTGSLLIETVFSLDGLGLLNFQSILRRDYAFVLSNIYILSLIGLMARLVSDVTLILVDPRITFDQQVG